MSHRGNGGEPETQVLAGTLTGASPGAIDLFGGVVQAVLAHRADAAARLDHVLEVDPGLAMAHLVRGFGLRFLARWDLRPRVEACVQAARASFQERGESARERTLCSALEASNRGAVPWAAARLDEQIAEDPGDILAIKLAHACRFMMGDATGMLRTARRAVAGLSRDHPGQSYAQGCLAFALEENGEFDEAERAGREASLRNPSDGWAVHAVAHVLLSKGRSEEGLAWMRDHEPHLQDCNNFGGHLAWHEALFHVDLGEYDAALDLHDRRIAIYPPGDYRDVSNATSLLYRLAILGVDVGGRWDALAQVVSAQAGDHGYAFADLHYVLAFAAAGRLEQARSFVHSLIDAASERSGFDADVLAEVGRPVAESIVALYAGDCDAAQDTLTRMRPELPRLGGSNAQRGFLTWLEEQAAAGIARERNGLNPWQQPASSS